MQILHVRTQSRTHSLTRSNANSKFEPVLDIDFRFFSGHLICLRRNENLLPGLDMRDDRINLQVEMVSGVLCVHVH